MDDRRLIEDFLPIEAISAEASREKSVRKGHISALHLWWARRPLVAGRAAVFGSLVSLSQFAPQNTPESDKLSIARTNAERFLKNLCKYPGGDAVISQAVSQILEAHAKKLSKELKESSESNQWPKWVKEFNWPEDNLRVTRKDIEAGKAPRPLVLDMFAGGGSIPLEALRLGCEAYAIDLNPVAHIIELCTLVYPQRFGRPDKKTRGMTGPTNGHEIPTWGGLVEEVRFWGNWVLEKVKEDIGDLYPLIPDPEYNGNRDEEIAKMWASGKTEEIPDGFLMPVAYLWTRTVKCKNPSCGSKVPLVKQTWLCKKKGRYAALKIVPDIQKKFVSFKVVEATDADKLGFNPVTGSKGGNAVCLTCNTVCDSVFVREEGNKKQIGLELMGVACAPRTGQSGKVYLSPDQVPSVYNSYLISKLDQIVKQSGLHPPHESINPVRPSPNARGVSAVTRHGFSTFGELFTTRQLVCLLSFAEKIREASIILQKSIDKERTKAVIAMLSAILDRLVDFNSSLCVLNYTGGRGVVHTFGRHALPMVWDFAETNPFNKLGASWPSGMVDLPAVLDNITVSNPASVIRGSAFDLPLDDDCVDAIITDPPYYDNVPYADVSDFFYVWLKRTLSDLFPEHFASVLTPKKNEATALASKFNGNMKSATNDYEDKMMRSFCEAHRVLKENGILAVVYAHKTTLGWSTLINSLKKAGFVVMEAWPMDTEKTGRLLSQGTAALASSIFIVARKRRKIEKGRFDDQLYFELQSIVKERVESLWDMGISGADIVIACVGAGLRAFTQFQIVEYENGEEVPSEKYLSEVETVVLETILERLSKEVGGNGRNYSLSGVDNSTRFYILWRYTYRWAELDAGEAIVFANGSHVELDGQGSLSSGSRALVQKKKAKYRLRDFHDRGDNEKLGLPSSEGTPAPMIDALHRTLWLMEKKPRELPEFLKASAVNKEQMRLVAQALAGPALKGGEMGDVSPSSELSALARLTANWKSVVEEGGIPAKEIQIRKTGQMPLFPEDSKT